MGAGPLVQRTRRRNRTPSAAIGAAVKQLSLSARVARKMSREGAPGPYLCRGPYLSRVRCGRGCATQCATGIRAALVCENRRSSKVEQSKEISGKTDSIRSTTLQAQRGFWCGRDACDFSRHRPLGHSKGLADRGESSACFRCARSS
jgi:hypothetical protein